MTKRCASYEFGRLRRYLWPLHSYELKKFIPLLIMCFFIGFDYNILRNMKDSLLVTAAGAEVIPFVKFWAMLPMAVLITSLFLKLSHRYSIEKVFYIVVSSFLGFFLVFTIVLYPLQGYLHPHGVADRLQEILPKGLGGMVSMVRYWSFSLFYAMAELWGAIVLTTVFWGFANEVANVDQARRFYGLLGIGANVSSIAGGRVSCFFAGHLYNPNWPIGIDRWHQTLILLTIAVAVAGLIVMALFRWFNVNVQSVGQGPAAANKKIDKLKSKGSIRENFSYLMKSKYLTSIAIVVVSYNIIINLVEVLWKSQVRVLHPDSNAYNHYMGNISMYTGIIATIMAFVVGNLIRKRGWTFSAMLTPAILFITSIGFVGCYLIPNHRLEVVTGLLGMTPIALTVLFGSIQNVLSRACKYTIFDTTKELAFIPITQEARVKGKAAIDGVGSRMGKSGGAVIYQGLLAVFGTLSRCAPIVAVMLVGVLSCWAVAVKNLGRQFLKLQAGDTEPEPTPATGVPVAQEQVI